MDLRAGQGVKEAAGSSPNALRARTPAGIRRRGGFLTWTTWEAVSGRRSGAWVTWEAASGRRLRDRTDADGRDLVGTTSAGALLGEVARRRRPPTFSQVWGLLLLGSSPVGDSLPHSPKSGGFCCWGVRPSETASHILASLGASPAWEAASGRRFASDSVSAKPRRVLRPGSRAS